MTGEEHAAEAERLLEQAAADGDAGGMLMFRASVHAQLADARTSEELLDAVRSAVPAVNVFVAHAAQGLQHLAPMLAKVVRAAEEERRRIP